MGNPESTEKLGYGTWEASLETALPLVSKNPEDWSNNLPGDPPPLKWPDYNSTGFQVGGFGNPPPDKPWATAKATRVDADGKLSKNGAFVEFEVINVAGAKSFLYHIPSDRPLGEDGPLRSMVQIFRWREPVKSNDAK